MNTEQTARLRHRADIHAALADVTRLRITDLLATNTQGVLYAQVQGTTGLTPFARWAGPWGLWPLIGLAVVLIVAVTRRPAS